MRRFYCTVCKKIKRTQKWPAMISNVSSEIPEQRQGMCNRHTKSMRAEFNRTNMVGHDTMRGNR